MSWKSYDRVKLYLKDGSIDSIKNLKHLKFLNDFAPEFKTNGLSKIYLVKDSGFYKYVGATTQAIHNKLNKGLKSTIGKKTYPYKWREHNEVELIVWTFEGLERFQMEAIEAELVFQIRSKYGKWPDFQNEIHFNNKFPFAKEIGKSLFDYIEKEYPLNTDKCYNKITEDLFKEPIQYGLRGDPHLWKDLKVRFEYSGINNLLEFKEFLVSTFKENTGSKPINGKNFNVKYFNFGGMSGGTVNSDFWIEKGFPLLEERFAKLKQDYR